MRFGLREIMFLILLLAIPLGSWWFVLRPRNTQLSELREQIQAKRVKLKALGQASTTITELQREIDDYNAAIDFFRSKLPQEKEMDKVMREVWTLAKESELATKSIRTLKRSAALSITDPDGPYAEQPISLELEGDFNQGLYNFLLSLEKKARITRIHQIHVKKLPKAAEGEVSARMEMSIFFERNGQED